jgi:hypothetical protein
MFGPHYYRVRTIMQRSETTKQFTVTLLETTYTIAAFSSEPLDRAEYWWLRFERAWFRIAKRQPHARTARREVLRWLARNATLPDEAADAEVGPAWTATQSNPVVLLHRNVLYQCWPATELSSGEAMIRWMIRSPRGTRIGPTVDCDDTIGEILHAVRGVTRSNSPATSHHLVD